MKIYRIIEGEKTEIQDIEVDQNTELNQKISGQDLIRSRFTSEGFKYDIQIGDFVEFKNARYTILDEPQVKKSQNSFTYDIQFKSDQYLYNNVQLKNPDTEEVEFYLFGSAIDMVSLVLHNMNRIYGTEGGTYYADYVEQTEGRNMRFNNVNCLTALDQIANEFECEFVIKGYELTFRKKIGKETGLTFRYKKELREIERQTIQNGELVTVLYPFGSERNITNDYGSKRLKIPKLTNNVEVFGTIERAKYFEDIYPRLKGVVASSSNYRTFRDTGIDFNINDQFIGGVTAKVVFNTGDLAGREYEIDRYNPSNKEIVLIPYTDDSNFTTPNETFRPRVGDKYVLINIEMPQAYIDNAEEELQERAQEYIDTYSQPNVIYKVLPHYPELRRQEIDIELGDIVTLIDEDFGIEFETRVLGLTQKVNSPFTYSLEIGNQVTMSYFSQVMGDQRDIRNDIYQNDRYYMEQFNRVYNNVRGLTAPLYVNRGEFSPANYYYNNQNRRDYVYRIVNVGGQETKEWYYYIGQDHQRAEWIEANWQLIGDNFEILATETLLAQNANIGKWLIQNGMIVSQSTYVDSSNESNNEPTVQLNGEYGFMKFVTKRNTINDSGRTISVKQTLFIDARTGRISAEFEGVESAFSPNGLVIGKYGGEVVEDPNGTRVTASIIGNGKGSLPRGLTYGNTPAYAAGVVGFAENSYAGSKADTYGGVFWDLKSHGRYVGVKRIPQTQTRYDIQPTDEVLSCYNTQDLHIYLPEPNNSKPGRRIQIKRINAPIGFHGKLLTSREQDYEDINDGDMWTLIDDGAYWLANYQGRAD